MSKKHHILILTYWSYDDALIQAYTLPYLKIIKQLSPEQISIHLVTFEKSTPKKLSFQIDQSILSKHIPLTYLPFGAKSGFEWIKSLFYLRKYIKANQITMIHSWCTPAGMIAYLLHKITGISFVSDSFEPHAESMVENGTWKKNSPAFKILFYFEKKIVKNAAHLISIAPGMNEYINNKFNIHLPELPVKPACVDLNKFQISAKNYSLAPEINFEEKLVCLYAGKFGGIYYETEVFDFFKVAADYLDKKIHFLILTGEKVNYINEKIKLSGNDPDLFTIKYVNHSEIQEWMGLADFAICPVKPVPSKKYCSPIKTGEYWAMGLPVIITNNISNDSAIIENSGLGYVWKSMERQEYINSVQRIKELLGSDKNTVSKKIRQLAERHRNYAIPEKIYRTIYL